MVSMTIRNSVTNLDSEEKLEMINLQKELDRLYEISANAVKEGKRPKHKNLLELITRNQTIIEAMDKISHNKGRKTPGIDNETWNDWENIRIAKRIEIVREAIMDYNPSPVRRVYIEKDGSNENIKHLWRRNKMKRDTRKKEGN